MRSSVKATAILPRAFLFAIRGMWCNFAAVLWSHTLDSMTKIRHDKTAMTATSLKELIDLRDASSKPGTSKDAGSDAEYVRWQILVTEPTCPTLIALICSDDDASDEDLPADAGFTFALGAAAAAAAHEDSDTDPMESGRDCYHV